MKSSSLKKLYFCYEETRDYLLHNMIYKRKLKKKIGLIRHFLFLRCTTIAWLVFQYNKTICIRYIAACFGWKIYIWNSLLRSPIAISMKGTEKFLFKGQWYMCEKHRFVKNWQRIEVPNRKKKDFLCFKTISFTDLTIPRFQYLPAGSSDSLLRLRQLSLRLGGQLLSV